VPGTADYLRALAVPPGGTVVYAGGQLTTASGRRTYAAAFDREAGDRTDWDSGADGPVRTLAPAGDALLLGGEFRQLGSRMQQGFGSFGLPDAAAGEQLTCAPPPPPPPEEPIVEEPPPPPPPPPAPRPAEPYRDTIAPVLRRVRFTHRRFRIRAARGARGAKRSRAPVGTRIRYALSEPAVLRLRLSRGTRVRCRSRAAKRPCYRWRRAGSLGHLSRAGSVVVAFRGRVGRHWLRAGRYRVWVQAVDPAGNRSAVQRRAFVVVRE
jgi:hypothetical protein